ncbi:plasmid mobilization relaxosome protein MobC [Neisseriaceae bacterium PsAf]|nr:plasmid mobilization relaxosome protein MobC [Neisseriaceae bacterium PsAf]
MAAIRIDDELYKKLRELARKNGNSIGQEANILLSDFLNSGDLENAEKRVPLAEESLLKNAHYKKKFLLNMGEELYVHLKEIANKHYTSVNKIINTFLINYIQNKKTVLSQLEIETLKEYNYELVAIGRNLNQIAKKLNRNEYDAVNEITVNLLNELITKIDDYNELIQVIILGNLDYLSRSKSSSI